MMPRHHCVRNRKEVTTVRAFSKCLLHESVVTAADVWTTAERS